MEQASELRKTKRTGVSASFSVTRLGDILDFGQLCKAFGDN